MKRAPIYVDFEHRSHRSWAIMLTNLAGGPGLVGYGFWDWNRPDHLSGYVTATWATRKQARAALAKIEGNWVQGRVVRVEHQIREVRK